MSEVADLVDRLNGAPDLRASLTEKLGLAAIGRRVVGAHVFGRGPSASVDLILDEGKVTFERFGDIAKPAALTAHIVTTTGHYQAFKGADAGLIASEIYKLATHHAEADQDSAVREFGSEFLRLAAVIEVNMTDQADRWRAFSVLARSSPARDAGEDRSAAALACAATVLEDTASGARYVRTGWLAAYVKREVGTLYSPAALAAQMSRVGWKQPNTQGRVKATNTANGRQLAWSFYVVERDWESTGDAAPTAEVTASYSSNARVHAHAREAYKELAVTRNPAEVQR